MSFKDAFAKLKLQLPPGDAVLPPDPPAVGRPQDGEPTTAAAGDTQPEPPPEGAVRFAAVLVRAAQLGGAAAGKPQAAAADIARRLIAAGKGTHATRGAWQDVVEGVLGRVKTRDLDGELTRLNGGDRPTARLTSKGVPSHDAAARDVEAALTGGWAVAYLKRAAEPQARLRLPDLQPEEGEADYLDRCAAWAADQTVEDVRLALGGQTVDSAAWNQIHARREREEARRRAREQQERLEHAAAEAQRVKVATEESEKALFVLMVRLRQDDLGDGAATIHAVLGWEAEWRNKGVMETVNVATRLLAEVMSPRHLVELAATRDWCAQDAWRRLLKGAIEVPELTLLAWPDARLAALVGAWAYAPHGDLPLAKRAARVLLDRHGDGYVARVPGKHSGGPVLLLCESEWCAGRAPRPFFPQWSPPEGVDHLPIVVSDADAGYARYRTVHGTRLWAWVSPAAQAARRRLEASLKARGVGSLFVRNAMCAYGRHPEKNFPRLVAATARSTVMIGIDEGVGRVLDDLARVEATFEASEIDPRWYLVRARGGKTVKGGWHIYEVRPGQQAAAPEAVVYLADAASGRFPKRRQTSYVISERGVCSMTSFACDEAVRSIFFASNAEPARLSDGRAIGYDPTGATVGAEGPTLTVIRGFGTESEAAPVAWGG